MSDASSYVTVIGRTQAEIVEKKSRFIASVSPVETEEEARAFLEEIRAEHRMARHSVYAYVLKKDGRVRYSDDGEPQKTAGLPTLDAIHYAGLTDIIVVTTRYFGGVLLGTGGLARAYTSVAQAALSQAKTVAISRCVDVVIRLAYALYEQAVRIGEANPAKMVDAKFADMVVITFRMLEGQQGALVEQIAELSRGQAVVEVSDSFDAAF